MGRSMTISRSESRPSRSPETVHNEHETESDHATDDGDQHRRGAGTTWPDRCQLPGQCLLEEVCAPTLADDAAFGVDQDGRGECVRRRPSEVLTDVLGRAQRPEEREQLGLLMVPEDRERVS